MLCRIPLRKTRTLIVESDRISRDALAGLLRLRGHLVDGAQTLHEALDKLYTFVPTRLIVDLRLPDGSGLDLLRRVREFHMPARIAAVVSDPNDVLTLRELRILKPDLLMEKPFDIAPILQFVR